MLIGGYEIPRRLLALILLLVVVIAAAVVVLVVKPFKGSSTHYSQTAVNTPVAGKKISAIKGAKITVSMKGGDTVVGGKFSAFATLTQKNQTLWTHRLSPKAFGSALPSGDYVLSVAFSPCKIKGVAKPDCTVFHGGVGIPPQTIKGGQNVTVVVEPVCKKVSYGTVGIDCSKTKVVTH